MSISWDKIGQDEEDFLKTSIYKIIDIKYVEEIIKSKRLRFLKANKWEDPFENLLFKIPIKIGGNIIKTDLLQTFADCIFGQSWTLLPESDALWRIYSQTKSSVRLKTAGEHLFKMIKSKSDDSIYCMLGDVKYKNELEIIDFIKTLKTAEDFKTDTFHEFSLFVKRKEFEHEKEFRIIFIADFDSQERKQGYIDFDIDPNTFIDEITLDPRLNDAEEKLVVDKLLSLGYTGTILKSKLYHTKDVFIELN